MPCGLPEKSQFASIHAEHRALEQYIYNNKGRRNKKLTLIKVVSPVQVKIESPIVTETSRI